MTSSAAGGLLMVTAHAARRWNERIGPATPYQVTQMVRYAVAYHTLRRQQRDDGTEVVDCRWKRLRFRVIVRGNQVVTIC